MSDVDVLKVLAKSLVSTGLLMGAGAYTLPHPTPLSTVQWASWVCVLSGFYYLAFYACRQCRRRRGGGSTLLPPPVMLQPMYVDLPQAPPVDYAEEPPRASLLEMSAASVYTYVYGWGVLLFVCLYCMTGLHEASACWWALGMLVLAFDDLITRGISRPWVVVVGALLYTSVVSLWWAASGSKAVDDSLGVVFLCIVLPVLSPFIFFSLRSTVRAVSRDVRVLLEVALPFMLIIAVSVLICTTDPVFDTSKSESGGPGSLTRDLASRKLGFKSNFKIHQIHHNATAHHAETPAPFNNTDKDSFSSKFSFDFGWHAARDLMAKGVPPPSGAVQRDLVLFATPLLAYCTITLLTDCVVRGYVTEFISAFMLALTTKRALEAETSIALEVALGAAGACFVFLVLLRRSL